MKRRFFKFILLCLLCVLLTGSAFADKNLIMSDGAGLLSDEEGDELNLLICEVYKEQSFQIVIVTVNGTDGSYIGDYADDLYDNGGYLADGALFLLDMDSREWYVSTVGRGIGAMSDTNIDEIMEEVLPYLSDGEYFEGFSTFIAECSWYVESYDNGGYVPKDEDYYEYDYDDYYGHDTQAEKSGVNPLWIPGSLGIGLVVALVATGVMKSKMNSVRAKSNASDYTKRGSLNLTEKQDIFLYHTVTRTAKPKDDNHRSGGGSFGGGVHTSSSGTSHGGHGGRF